MASVIRGSGASTLGGALDVQGVLTYEDVTSVDSVGIITARSGINVGTGASISSPDTNELALGTNNVERLRISSGGDVTTTGADYNRANAGFTARAGDSVNVTRASGTPLEVNRTGSDGTIVNFFQDGSVVGSIGVDSNDLWFGANGSSYTESFRITSGGNALFGGTAVSQTNRQLVVGSNAGANLAIETHNTSASVTANIRFYRSRGTAASPTTLVDNDVISQLVFYGHDGTDYAHAAATIKVECDGTVASNQMPGAMSFYTNAGGPSATERLRITSDGQFEMNGVRNIYQSFFITGNQSYDWDFTVPAEGSWGNSFYLVAGFNHYYTTAYGAHRVAWFSARGSGVSAMIDQNQSHSQSGGWTVSKPDSTTFRVTKTAGSLNAPGYGFFHLTYNHF